MCSDAGRMIPTEVTNKIGPVSCCEGKWLSFQDRVSSAGTR